MIKEQGTCYLPDYLDTILTNDECFKCVELMCADNQVTIKDYTGTDSFLLEHNGTINGHIPEDVFW